MINSLPMELIEQLSWRYATKKFDDQRLLSAEQIEVIQQSFGLTATSYGLQPLKLVVVQDKAIQEQLVAHSFGQKQVGQASAVLVICVEQVVDAAFVENYFDRVQQVRNTPAEVLAPFRKHLLENFVTKPKEDLQLWASKQAYIALGNLLTTCAILRIDSCPMEGFSPQGYDEVLGLTSRGLTATLVMPIGYRASDDFMASLAKVRRPISEVIIEIKG